MDRQDNKIKRIPAEKILELRDRMCLNAKLHSCFYPNLSCILPLQKLDLIHI